VTTRTVIRAELLYGRLLATAVQHALGSGPAVSAGVRRYDGRFDALPLDRWLGSIDAADAAILERVTGPVLDIGCGPGRHLAALRGRRLGVDLSPIAVRIARRRGVNAVLGSVFDRVPGAGTWDTALLLDGNVGIGGAPGSLLHRARELLSPGGTVLAELEPPGTPTRVTRVRLEWSDLVSDWFSWGSVGVDGIGSIAAGAGFGVSETLEVDGRWFTALERR
jgi:SAM-dependent methyltransferase